MKTGFAQNFAMVSAAHFATILCIVILAALPSCRKQARVIIPLQLFDNSLLVDGSPLPMPAPEVVAERAAEAPEHVEESVPEREPAIVKESIRKTQPVVKKTVSKPPVRPPKTVKSVKKSSTDRRKKSAPVSAAAIARILNSGVGSKPGSSRISVRGLGAGVADADSMFFSIVKQAFYDTWDQPAYVDVGGAATTVAIQLSGNGVVSRATLAKSSGNPVMDASVMQAAQSVRRIDGLPADFVSRHPDIQIVFSVVNEGARL
ncbi:MAG: TonB family protein [bacterium]